jgi:hypothetical protein
MLQSGRSCETDYSLTSHSSLSTQQCAAIHCSAPGRPSIERSHVSASIYKAYLLFSSLLRPPSLFCHCLIYSSLCTLSSRPIHPQLSMLVITLSAAVVVGTAVFDHSNTGVEGTNPTRGEDVCLCLFCV